MQSQSCPAPQSTWSTELSNLVHLPGRVLLGSTLIILNLFQHHYQQRQLASLLKTIKRSCRTDQQARQDLLRYNSLMESTNTHLCPVMTKSIHSQEFKTGILINGEMSWSLAVAHIRSQLQLPPQKSVSFICGGDMVVGGQVEQVFRKYVDSQDGVMYLQYIQLQSYG